MTTRAVRPGERDALLLPAGELPGAAGGKARGADLLEPPQRDRTGLRLPRPLGARPEGDVLQDAEVRQQQGLLGHERDLPPVRRDPVGRAGHRPAGEVDPAAARSQRARRQPDDGRLAGPVGAEHGEHLPLGDLETDLDVAHGHLGVDGKGRGHGSPPVRVARRGRCVTSTSTAASRTSTRESAIAASGSVSRWR